MLTVICLVLDWGDDPITTINSVTKRNDRTRGGRELLAFVDSGAVDIVLPQVSVYRVSTGGDLEVAERSWFQRSKRVAHQALWATAFSSQDKRRKQKENHVGGRRCAQTADLRQRLLERGHKLVLDEKPRIQCKNGDTIPLERTGNLFAVRFWIPKGFHKQG